MSSFRGLGIPLFLATAASLVPQALGAGEVPRTASGRPDLSGNYDISTLTPVERPAEYEGRLYLTEQETADVGSRAAAITERLNAPSDPNRSAPPAGGNVGGYNYHFLDRGTGAMAIDGRYPTSILVDPPNGRFPPLTERGKKRRAGLYPFSKENTGDAWWLDRDIGPYDGPESLSIADRCIFSLEATIPIYSKAYNNVKTIVQTETHVVILIEWMHESRVIRLVDTEQGRKAKDQKSVASRAGDSIGWWEGDTLVVETTNFLEENWMTTTLFGEPSPSSDQHVVERFTRTDEDSLLYEFTVESGDHEAPYSGRFTWPATEQKLYEYACHEGNYAVGNILRGARLLEREATQ